MSVEWPFIQTMIQLISLIGAVAVFGLVGTMKQTISSQKEYIGQLKARTDDLKVENAEVTALNRTLEHQFKVVHTRIDNLRDSNHHQFVAKIEEIKELLENQS